MSSNAASALDPSVLDIEHNVEEVAAMQNSTDLESRLRGMILSNSMTPLLHPHTQQAASPNVQEEYKSKQSPIDAKLPLPPKANTSSRKPNQAQRKQLHQQLNQKGLPTPIQSSSPKIKNPSQRLKRASENTVLRPPQQVNDEDPAQRVPRTTQTLPPRSIRDVRTPREQGSGSSRPRHLQGGGAAALDGPAQGQYNTVPFLPGASSRSPTEDANLVTRARHNILSQAYSGRPAPQSRQLFDPSVGGAHQTFHPRSTQPPARSLRAQVMFLEETAVMEIRKAEISPRDLEEKEALRMKLEQISRTIVTAHETLKQGDFDAGSVALKCYGSLSSGFATKSSDMDLAFSSPSSVPSTTSTNSEIPRLLEEAFLKAGYGARLLTRTRVPIIKFCEKPTPDLLEALRKNREKWERFKDQPLRCCNCGGEGHLSHSCTAPKKPKPCYRCGEIGHVVKNCNGFVLSGIGNMTAQRLDNSGQITQPKAAQESLTPSGLVIDGKPEIQVGSTVQSHFPTHAETQSRLFPEDSSISLMTDGHDPSTLGPAQEAVGQTDVPESDEELVHLYHVAMEDGCFDEAERVIIREFIHAVQQYGPNSTSKELLDTRLHLGCFSNRLQRYRDRLSLDFPKAGVGVQCDINFSNQLALHNTLMLRCYSHCDPRVRPMILAIKSWAKTRKINSPYHGTLSSYGYVLMVLHYLVNVARPPLIPNLQLCRKAFQEGSGSKVNDTLIDGCNVRFWRSESEILECAAANQLTVNQELLGSLVRGFFEYFAMPVGGGFSWSYDVLSLRTQGGILSKKEKNWTAAKTIVVESGSPSQPPKEIRQRYLFAIEDPFELDHNIARTVVHYGIVAIRDEFRRANAIIRGVQEGDLFAEAEDRLNLQTRPPPSMKPANERIKGNISTGGKDTGVAKTVQNPAVQTGSTTRRDPPPADRWGVKPVDQGK